MNKKHELTQDILNTMSRTFQHFVDNADDVSVFYNSSRNVFLKELYGSNTELENYLHNTFRLYKMLESKINSNIEQIKKEDILLAKENKNLITIEEYKEILQKRLDFMFNCIYAYEVKSGASFFVYHPPYYDDLTKFALSRRIDNFSTYKKINEYWTTKCFDKTNKAIPKDIFISETSTAKEVLKGNFGNSMRANTNYVLDDKTQNELIFNVKKTLIYEKLHKSSSLNYEYLKRFYIGYYQDKPVLFSEIISKVNEKSAKSTELQSNCANDLQNVGYQLNLVLNGDVNENRLLYRMDYMPINNHINKLEYINQEHNYTGSEIEKKNQEFFEDSVNHKSVFHMHIPSEEYSVLFPNFLHSADAKNFNKTFKNFDEFVNFNRRLSKIDAKKCFIDNKELKILLSSKKLKDKKLLDCIKAKEFLI